MIYYKDDSIIIRDLEERDITQLFSWWIDKEINHYDPRPMPETIDGLLEECIHFTDRFKTQVFSSNLGDKKYIFFFITDTLENPIGFINIFSFNEAKKQCEMGIAIGDKRYWGKGIASKALKIVTDYIFNNTNVERIYIETSEHNAPSIRLFENNGFKQCFEYYEEGMRFIVMELLSKTASD